MDSELRGIELVVASLDAGRATIGARAASLSAQERERAGRFRSGIDRHRYIAAHSRLRELLGARCGAPPASLQFEAGTHGKPALRGSRLQFSLSRNAGLGAFAFAWDRPVGIDIEAIRPFAGADAIAARTFPLCERRAYAALAACDRAQRFFRGWTRTEALAKALGGGLALSPEALDVALEGRPAWVVHSFAPAPGFAGAVAYRNGAPSR